LKNIHSKYTINIKCSEKQFGESKTPKFPNYTRQKINKGIIKYV